MDDARPIPDRGHDWPGRTFRIRAVMLAIVGIAVWLAVFREWPAPAVVVAMLGGPTLAIYRWALKEDERVGVGPPDLLTRLFLLIASALMALLGLMGIGFVLLFLVVIIAQIWR